MRPLFTQFTEKGSTYRAQIYFQMFCLYQQSRVPEPVISCCSKECASESNRNDFLTFWKQFGNCRDYSLQVTIVSIIWSISPQRGTVLTSHEYIFSANFQIEWLQFISSSLKLVSSTHISLALSPHILLAAVFQTVRLCSLLLCPLPSAHALKHTVFPGRFVTRCNCMRAVSAGRGCWDCSCTGLELSRPCFEF